MKYGEPFLLSLFFLCANIMMHAEKTGPKIKSSVCFCGQWFNSITTHVKIELKIMAFFVWLRVDSIGNGLNGSFLMQNILLESYPEIYEARCTL